MKKICFVVPYFGKMPSYFQIWLDSCKKNSSIDWIIFTDDRTTFDYPNNVKVRYLSFLEMKELVQKNYDFEISLDNGYKLVDYKIAYGEIFHEYLIEYDFWGFCDIDLIWGDIRKFYTEDILDEYSIIGNQGHATIFKNTKHNNLLYRSSVIESDRDYKAAFTTNAIKCTDVVLIKKICEIEGIKVYRETIYAGLEKYDPGFYLQAMPKDEGWKNRRQVFVWDEGVLTRYYLDKQKDIVSEEYLYIHFFSRPMKNKIQKMDRILIYPDVYENFYDEVTTKIINRKGHKSKLFYYFRVIKQNKNRLTPRQISKYLKYKRSYLKRTRK